MDGTQGINVENLTPEQQEEILDELEDQKEEEMEDQAELSQDLQDLGLDPKYPGSEADSKHNQHTFLNRAAFEQEDTVRTTFLSPEELGRPLFSVRFLLDMHKMAVHDNLDRIAAYYKSKIQNISHSGMSNKGFAMNLNVTQKKDMTRRKFKQSIVKGGEKK